MPQFTFRAADQAGTLRRGKIEAANEGDVLRDLASRGWIGLRISKANRLRAALSSLQARPPSLKFRDLVGITQELGALLKAGLTIDRALIIVRSVTEKPTIKFFLGRLLDRVREGISLADALLVERGVPSYLPSMVRAGEVGGALPEVMTRAAIFMARAKELRDRIVSALIYPLILLCMIGMTLALVVFVVLPRFERLFADAGATLPWPTRVVMALGAFIRKDGPWVIVIGCAAAFVCWRQWQNLSIRLRIHRRLIKLPAVGSILCKIETGRFFRTLATLIANGATVPAGIQIASKTLSNLALVEDTVQILQRLREGESFADRLRHAPGFPRLAVQLAQVGEETGQLAPMLFEASDILEREAQQSLERALAILVPSVTIGMGVLVAALISSVLVGILSLNDLAY